MSKETKFHDVVDDRDDADAEYKVGFGKPPKSGQFEKGRSGNPKGRPKADFTNWKDPVCEVLFEKLVVPIKGKPVSQPSILWMLRSMRNNAIKGCHRSFKVLMDALGDRGLKGLWHILQEETRVRSEAEIKEAMRWLYEDLGMAEDLERMKQSSVRGKA
jgi:uncharacterized protein DUF5681